MRIITRADWNARSPKRRHYIETPTPELWIHHFGTEAWHGAPGMRACQKFHMDAKGWSDIAYSFCVDDDGAIYEGRGVGIAGGHTQGRNTISHAICAMGNLENRPPTEAMIASIAALARHGRDNQWWGDITGGHKDAPGATTQCAGRFLQADIPAIRQLVNATTQEDDLLMAAALNDDDARRALVRQWFWTYLGRGPKTAKEQDTHVWVFATKGADLCLAGIVDSKEAAAYRKASA